MCGRLLVCCFVMLRRPPRSTRTDTLFPYTTLFRSAGMSAHSALGAWFERRWSIAKCLPALEPLGGAGLAGEVRRTASRSEEHTSELQSLMRISYAVFCLKKKKNTTLHTDKSEYSVRTHTHMQSHHSTTLNYLI